MRATITNAGYAALINANNNGTLPVTLAKVALGSGTTAADKTDTALEAEIKQIDTISGEAVNDNVIHVTIRDESMDEYTVREFGLMLADGTLFARYAQADTIIEKSKNSTLLLSIDCEFADIDATNITFGDVSFSNPPASKTVQGVAEIADNDEADEGTDDKRIMTPAKVKRVLPKAATTTKPGIVEIATQEEVDEGADDQRSVTPKKLRWKCSFSLGTNGHIALPSWLGGIILQWGVVKYNSSDSHSGTIQTLPIAFESSIYQVIGSDGGKGSNSVAISVESKSQLRVWGRDVTTGLYSNTDIHFLAIGK